MLKKYAFTLAEVLVTLMIIGVIASMTIPGLRKNAEQEELVASLKKAYSVMNQATKMVELEHGDYKRWRFKDGSDDDVQRMYDWYKKYLNIGRECPPNTVGCWAQTVTLSNAVYSNAYGIGANTISFSLADGMNVCFDGTGEYGINGTSGQLGIWVDVNGDKTPNKLGMDVFLFAINKDRGLLPAGSDNGSADCIPGGVGATCAAKIIKQGKLD